jgi:hypothetical protein
LALAMMYFMQLLIRLANHMRQEVFLSNHFFIGNYPICVHWCFWISTIKICMASKDYTIIPPSKTPASISLFINSILLSAIEFVHNKGRLHLRLLTAP